MKKSGIARFLRKLARCRKLRKRASKNIPVKAGAPFSIKRALGKYLCIFLFSLFVLIFTVLLFLDSLLVLAFTGFCSWLTGSEVTAERVEVSFSRGDIKVINLQIANPGNFPDGKALVIDSLYCAIDKNSIFSDQLIVRQLEIRNADITPEISADGRVNLLLLTEKLRKKENTQGKKYPKIETVSLYNIFLQVKDHRSGIDFNGFKMSLNKFIGTAASGKALMQGLRIAPPDEFGKEMLEINSVMLQLLPASPDSGKPVIESCEINDPQAAIVHSGKKHTVLNEILTAADNFMLIPDDNSGKNTVLPEIRKFTINNAALMLYPPNTEKALPIAAVAFKTAAGSLSGGNLEMKNFTMSTPGNHQHDLLKTGSVKVDFQPGSLLTQEIIIRNIAVENISASACLHDSQDSNIHEFINTLSGVFAELSQPDNDDTDDTSVKIDNFSLKNGLLTIRSFNHEKNEKISRLRFSGINGSWSGGQLILQDLAISDPIAPEYAMLKLKQAEFKFVPESLTAPVTLINEVKLDEVNVTTVLYPDKRTDIYELPDVLQSLIYPLFSGNIDPAADTDTSGTVQVQNYTVNNSNFFIIDRRDPEQQLDGFGYSFRQLHYSASKGILQLDKMKVFNLRTGISLLDLNQVNAAFNEADLNASESKLNSLNIDGLHLFLEYDRSGRSNIHECADTLCTIVSREQFNCKPLPDTTENEEKIFARIAAFSIDNSSFTLHDKRQQVPPFTQPLKHKTENFTLSSSSDESDLTDSIHESALELSQKCDGVTNPGELFLRLLNSSAASTYKLLQKNVVNGGKVFQKIFKF